MISYEIHKSGKRSGWMSAVVANISPKDSEEVELASKVGDLMKKLRSSTIGHSGNSSSSTTVVAPAPAAVCGGGSASSGGGSVGGGSVGGGAAAVAPASAAVSVGGGGAAVDGAGTGVVDLNTEKGCYEYLVVHWHPSRRDEISDLLNFFVSRLAAKNTKF